MRRVLFAMTLLVFLFVSACGASAAATQGPQEPAIPPDQPTATPTQVPAPTPTHVRVDLTPAQLAAIKALSEQLSLSVDKITLVSSEAVTWPNGCLGIVKIGVMCTQNEVPGFKIILEANGQKYEFHTNQNGSIVQLAEGAQNADAVEQELIKQLAANLRLQESDIKVVSNTEIEFPDSCLGVAMPDIMCSQIVTPGLIVVLEANGVQYEYHTNADGSTVQPATIAMVWKREGGIAGFCDSMTVFLSGEVYSNRCKPESEGKMGTFANLLSAKEQTLFNDWMTQFGSANLDASDPKGVSDQMKVTLDVFGSGSKQPTKAEQQQLFDFAQNLFQKLNQ